MLTYSVILSSLNNQNHYANQLICIVVLITQTFFTGCKTKDLAKTNAYHVTYDLYVLDTISFFKINTINSVSGNNKNKFKITDEGCISYFTDNNYIVKDCDGKILKAKVYDYNRTQELTNFSWIDSNRVLLAFTSIYFAHMHDLSVYVCNITSEKVEIKYDFTGSEFFHSKFENLDSLMNANAF
jgi:hypothetical protein